MTAQERFDEAYEELGYVTDQAAPVTLEQVKFAAVNLERERQGMSVRRTAEALGVGKSKIYGILERAGRSFAGAALLVLVVGCSTPKHEIKSSQVPRPPMPRTPRSSTGSEANHVARAVSAPVGPPAPQRFSWENWPGARIAVIEKSPDMVTWTQIGRVTNQTHFWVSFDGARGFYRVGHPAHETHHWFDPVLEIYKCDLE